MVGSFYDPDLDEGCAFEELISFHGGLGGPQTRPFVLYPTARLAAPAEPLVGAAAVHALLAGWRASLQPAALSAPAQRPAPGPERHGRRRASTPRPPQPPTAALPAPGPDPRPARRSRRVVGLVVSLAAWGFLELVHQVQVGDVPEAPRAARLRRRRAGLVAAARPRRWRAW